MSATHKSPASRSYLWWAWIGYWFCLFIVMHIPKVGVGGLAIKGGDKVLHFCLYFLLTWLGGKAVASRSGHLRLSLLALWMLIYILYGAVDEWTQQYVGRTTSLYDWLADSAGVASAAGLLWFTSRGSRREARGGES
jgi:VanZ family protein